jgi:hypothetical protein
MKKGVVKFLLELRACVNLCPYKFHIYFPIRIKFSMRSPLQYSNSVEYFLVFGKIRYCKGHTFLMEINEFTVTRVL